MEYLEGFIVRETADKEFARLWEELPWEKRDDAPRQECWMNDFNLPYTYGRGAGERTYEAKPWDAFVRSVMLALNERLDAGLNCCFINGYRHGRDQLGWHADDSPEMNPKEPVVVVTLGAERDIMFRNKMDHTTSRQLLQHGSMLVMPKGFQQTHEHRIPKVGHEIGPRLSMTFRGMIP